MKFRNQVMDLMLWQSFKCGLLWRKCPSLSGSPARRLRIFQASAALLLAFMGLSGCGGQSVNPPPPPPPPAPAAVTPAVPPDAPMSNESVAAASSSDPSPLPASEGTPSNGMPTEGASAERRPFVKKGKNEPEPERQADPELLARIVAAAATAGPADVDNGMKRIGIALTEYATAHDQRFPTVDGSGEPEEKPRPNSGFGANNFNNSPATKVPNGLSWRVLILPQLGFQELYSQFHLDEDWDSPNNRELVAKMPPVYGNDLRGNTRLQLITGPETPFQPGVGPLISDFTDGLSTTLTVVEAGPDQAKPWTKPGGLTFAPDSPAACLGEIGDRFRALTADGTLHSIPANTELLASLIRHQDRQVIPSQFLKETEQAIFASPSSLVSADLPPLQPADQEFDPRFIPGDAASIIVISPRRILESRLSQAILKEFATEDETHAQTLDRLTRDSGGAGLSILATEEIRILPNPAYRPAASTVNSGFPTADMSSPDSTGLPGGPAGATLREHALPSGVLGIYARTAVALPIEAVIRKTGQSADQLEVEALDGIPHVWLRGLPYALAFPSDHEVILASNESIRKMTGVTTESQKTSTLIPQVQEMKNAMVLLAASAPEGSKLEFMQQFLSAAGPVALFAPQLADLHDIRCALDLDAPEFLRIWMGFPEAEVAKTFSTVANGLLMQGITQGKQFQSLLDANDPSQKAQADLLGDVIQGTTVNQEKSVVSLTMVHPEHLESLVPAFQNQISAAKSLMAPLESLPPLVRVGKALVAYSEEHGHLPASNGNGEDDSKSKESKVDRLNPQNADAFQSSPGGGLGTPQRPSAEEKAAAAIAKNRGLSWRVYLLPFIGEKSLYEQFHLNERWDSPHNKLLLTQMPAIFGTNPEGKTRIQMIVGNDTLFKSGKAPDLESLRDDPSQTIVVIEVGEDKSDFWTKPGGLPFNPKDPLKCLGKPDAGQMEYQLLMLDWSLSSLPVEISADEFRELVQPSDGKPARKF